ncbi:MAG: hypothetical protein KIT36_19025, partial [Alphaproteobacteria bacterium]|nr:hypothetical protein [Alphaproteobacteria bacterium]
MEQDAERMRRSVNRIHDREAESLSRAKALANRDMRPLRGAKAVRRSTASRRGRSVVVAYEWMLSR